MKNILVVIDGLNFSASQLDSVLYISRLMKGKLTVALLDVEPSPFPMLLPGIQEAMYYSAASMATHVRERHEQVVANTEKLREACTGRGMKITLHTYTEAPLASVIRESRFADVLLAMHSLSFSGLPQSDPPGFMQALFSGAECPVLTLPDNMQVVKEIALTYNGTFSSMFAIRAFFQLMPLLALRKVKLVYVAENNLETLPDEQLLRQYIKGVCPRAEYIILKGDPAKSLLTYLRYSKHTLVTFGAYGRSRASRFFNGSIADDTLGLGHLYTFITHP
ncbi:universal stress protein [Chitinophaga lutea]|uniref:Universal stress protein n=1 Tax=Chitinophaga lutea TaxID=2488634 RepID=A0A3N4QAW5_9BACT|nr:universal stress protein [Chitinophaga lutea]RPE08894.1 universal stress protein [Chitinophaga lutea]